MDLGINGKVALVCASSEGIGKGIARALAAEGAAVVISSRSAVKLERAAAEIEAESPGRVTVVPADLSRSDDIDRLVAVTGERLGPIDILVHNQGGPVPGAFDDVTEADLADAVQLSLNAVFRLTKLVLPAMKQRRSGRIVAVLSASAKEPLAGLVLSNIVRPAVLGLCKSLATEAAPFGVTVNCVLPASVMSQRTRSLFERRSLAEGRSFEEIERATAASIPVGRIATPEEFAQLVVFLCSPRAGYITGTATQIDGGAMRGLY